MNVVTFNDKIKEMCMGNGGALQKMSDLFPGWQIAPLFLYNEASNEAETAAIVTAWTDQGQAVLEYTPFPVFRVDVTVGHNQKPKYGKYKAKALVANYEDGLAVFGRVDDLLHSDFTYGLKDLRGTWSGEGLPLYIFIHKVVLSGENRPGKVDFLCDPDAMFGMGGRWLDPTEINRIGLGGTITTYFNGLMKSVAAFNVSAMSPNNHIAVVHPNQPHRSVEWIKARTHYTLITHGHPANDGKIASGSRVSIDSDEELTRMAHNRRAHQRTLRSERFRYARGKTIWVKATWVGPKEWKDEGGRQIYKILEPVAQEIAA